MSPADSGHEPDWDAAIDLQLAPAAIIHALFGSAESVHTGWESCIQHDLVVFELSAIDDHSDNHCRLIEQEYVEDPSQEITWHDWIVELKLGRVYISAHWRVPRRQPRRVGLVCRPDREGVYCRGGAGGQAGAQGSRGGRPAGRPPGAADPPLNGALRWR